MHGAWGSGSTNRHRYRVPYALGRYLAAAVLVHEVVLRGVGERHAAVVVEWSARPVGALGAQASQRSRDRERQKHVRSQIPEEKL